MDSIINSFREWFKNTEPAIADYYPDQAQWEYLKEKHQLLSLD